MQSAGLMVNGVQLHAALREASSALSHEHELLLYKLEEEHRRSTANQVKVTALELRVESLEAGAAKRGRMSCGRRDELCVRRKQAWLPKEISRQPRRLSWE